MLLHLRFLLTDLTGSSTRDCAIVLGLFAAAAMLWLAQMGGESGLLSTLGYIGGRAHEVARISP